MKCIEASDSVPRKLAMEAVRIHQRIYWEKNIEKHMENGYHIASFTTIALCHCLLNVCVCVCVCVSVCLCVADFGAAFFCC